MYDIILWASQIANLQFLENFEGKTKWVSLIYPSVLGPDSRNFVITPSYKATKVEIWFKFAKCIIIYGKQTLCRTTTVANCGAQAT